MLKIIFDIRQSLLAVITDTEKNHIARYLKN